MRSLTVIFLLSALLFVNNINGQNSADKISAIVTLHDGSHFVGEVVNQNKLLLDLAIFTGDTITIDRRLAKKILTTEKDILVHPNGKYHYTQGLFWGMNMGLNLFSEDRPSTHLDFKIGHRFSTKLSGAVGLSFEYNRAIVCGFTFDTQFSTMYAYGRYYITENKKRLFAYSRIGYGSPAEDNPIEEEHTGGWQMQNGIGIHFAAFKRSRFILSLGHHYQKTSGKESLLDQFGNEVITEFDILISRPIISFGFEIK